MFQSRCTEAVAVGARTPFRSRPGDLSRLVRDALEERRVTMEFQPVVMAEDPSRMRLHVGFTRILDGDGRIVPTGSGMGTVVGSAIGRDLDAATLRLGLLALRERPGLRLAVHASVRSLGNPSWRATLEEGLRDLGPRLTLVVGEGATTVLADRVARIMAELRPQGVSFVLNDFGTGPLSLRHLQEVRFAGVKIDRALVRGIDASPERQALVGALVSVAHRFGMFAVAKGVETEGEAAQLRALGVDGLQGFLFGLPGPLA